MEDENKDKVYALTCCGQHMTVEFAGYGHDYPRSYTCLKCGAMVIPYKQANSMIKEINELKERIKSLSTSQSEGTELKLREMIIDKRNKIIMDCEEAIDEILHKEGYVFDHKRIRDKVRELLDENLKPSDNSRTIQSAYIPTECPKCHVKVPKVAMKAHLSNCNAD